MAIVRSNGGWRASTSVIGSVLTGPIPIRRTMSVGRWSPDHRALAYPHEQTNSGGEDEFASDLRVHITELPSDGASTLTASWPEAGLAEGSITLTLASLDDLENRVIRLPSS
jgi:hypothetical protein